ATNGTEAASEECAEIGLGRAQETGPRKHLLEQVQHGAPAGPGRQHEIIPTVEENGADLIALAGEKARHDGREFGKALALADVAGAKIDRGTEVEQEPGGNLPILVIDADMGHLRAGGDVPVDMADI